MYSGGWLYQNMAMQEGLQNHKEKERHIILGLTYSVELNCIADFTCIELFYNSIMAQNKQLSNALMKSYM